MQTSLQLGSKLLKGLGVMSDDVAFLSQLIRDSMELQAQEATSHSEYREIDIMKPLQVLQNVALARVNAEMWFFGLRELTCGCVRI